jgi:rhamnose utilization protein RhaD (predicted bifunctional aldolase and dehydrogenase)
MRNRPWPRELDIYSALIGSNPRMVQGPGGNTSFKNEHTMWVKASGARLSMAEDQEIFAEVEVHSGIQANPQSQLNPSIEKDFHLLVPFPYVIHTHSLRSISMAIVDNFGNQAQRHPNIAFVDYARPGNELCALISHSVDFRIHKAAILQNHGFLTWGSTMEEAYSVLEEFENAIPEPSGAKANTSDDMLKIDHPKAITPDYAVFLSPCTEKEILEFNGKNLWKKQMYALAQRAGAIAKAESEINYLPASEVISLQDWDAEKLRKAAN